MNEYLSELYNWISSQDNTFQGRRSKEEFISKMQNDAEYNQQMYSWISGVDTTFKDRYTTEAFQSKTGLKKKDELQPTSQEGDTVSTIKEKTTPTSLESSESLDQIKDNVFELRAQLPKEEGGFGEYIVDALDVGVSTVSKSIYDLPSYIYDAFATITNPIARTLGIEEASSEKFAETFNLKNIPSEIVGKRIAKKQKEIQEYNDKNGGDALSALENGNVLGAAKMVAGTTAQSLPLMIPAFLSGGSYVGLGTIGLSTASTKAAQLKEENPEIDVASRTINATATGMLEATLGQLLTGSAGAVTKRILAQEGSKKGAKIITDSFRAILEEGLEKSPVTSLFGEMLEEGLVSVGEQLTDISTGVKNDFDFREVINSSISATGMGGVNTVAIYGSKGYVAAKEYDKLKKLNKKLSKLSNELDNTDLSVEEKNLLKESIERLNSKGKKIIDDTVTNVSLLPEEQRKELENTILNLDRISISAFEINSSNSIPKEVKKVMLDELKAKAIELTQKKDNILSKNYRLNEFESLPDDEKIKLKEEAASVLLKEYQDSGQTNINITDDQISKKALDIFTDKKELDAIQEQETRDIPDAKPAEGIQEMETEVQEPAVQKEKIKIDDTQKEQIDKLRQQEIEEVELAIARSNETGEIPVVKGEPVNTSTIEDINKKYDKELETDKETAQYLIDLKSTKNSDPTTYWSVSDVEVEVAEDSTIIDTEDGSTVVKPDGDIAGLFKKVTSKAKGVAQNLLKRAVEAGGRKLDNFDGYLTKQYEKAGFRVVARTPFNKEYAPFGWNQETHGTPDVVAMIYDPNNELDIEERMFDDPENGYDQMIEYRDSLLPETKITKKESEKVTPEVTEGVSKLRDTFNKKGLGSKKPNTPAQKVNIEDQAIKAKQSISKLFPNVEIEVYYNENDYHQAIGDEDQSGGTYFNNKVYINLTRATDTTVAHEVFHAVLSQSLKSDTEIQNLTKKFVDSLINGNDKEVIQALSDKVATIQQYKDVANEEVMAELFGVLAGFGKKLKPKTRSLVKRFLDRVAKILGLKRFTDKELIDVLNTLSKKVASGEGITESDISIISSVDQGSLFQNTYLGTPGNVVQTKTNRKSLLSTNIIESDLIDTAELAGKPLEVVYYDNFTSEEYVLRNRVSGSTITKNGEGGPGYSYRKNIRNKGIIGAFTTVTKGLNLVQGIRSRNSIAKEDSVIGVALQNKETGHLGNKTTLRDFYHPEEGVISKAVQDGVISNEAAVNILKNAVDNYSNLAVGQKKNLGFNSKNFNSIEEFFNLMNNLSFELRGTFNSVTIPSKPNLKITKSTKPYVQAWLDSGVPTLSEYNEATAEPYTKNAKPHDIVKYLSPDLNVIGVDSSVKVSDVETDRAKKMGVKIVKIDDSASHTSYPVVLFGKNVGIPTMFHSIRDMAPDWNVSNPFFKAGRRKDKSDPVRIPEEISSERKPEVSKAKKQVSGKPSIDEVRKFAKENNISNADTNTYLKELGYTQEEIATKIEKEEGIYVKKGNKVVDWLKKTKRYLLSAKGFLPKNVFIAKEKKDQLISAEISIAERTAKRLNKLLKNQSEEVFNEVNNLMTGKEFKLPREIALVATQMREHIDSLSTKLVESGAVKSEESIENIKNNLGSYLNRSYKVFDDKNWASKVSEEVVQEAKQYLKNSWYNQESKLKMAQDLSEKQDISLDEWINKKVDQEVNDIVKQKEANSFIVAATEGSKNLKVLKQRKEIPAEIRALMGEYNDPSYNYVVSVAKIINIVENQKFLEKIKDIGDGVFLFKEGEIRRGDDTRYVKVAAESNESLAPLNGYYMPKEIVEQLKSQDLITLKESWFKKLYSGWLKSVATVKKSKTIYSIGTHGKNVFGNARFMAQNGYLNPSDYNNAFKVLKNQFKGATDTELNELLDKYKKLGVINQSVNLNEIRSMFSGKDSFDIRIEKRMLKQTENKTYKNAKQKLKNIDKFLEDMYQAEDDLFKIVAYENEKRDYSDILYNKKYEELSEKEKQNVDDYVSNIVKNILPNYSRIGNLGKGLKFIPVTGTFISFQIEAYRTAYNTVGLAINEIKSDNAKMRTKGAKRLVALMAVEGLKQSLLYFLGASFLGDDDEEEKISANDVRPFLPEWAKNSDIIVTSLGDGNFSYINVSASDPYGGIFQILNAAARGEDMSESIAGALKEFGDPVLSQDIFLSAIDDIVRNKTQYGGDLIEVGDDIFDKTGKITERLWTAFEPGTVTSLRKIAKSKSFEEVGYSTIGMFTGLKPHTVDVEKILSFKLKDVKDDMSKIKKEQYRAEYKVIDTGELGDLFEAYKNVDKKLDPVFKDANNSVKKAMRLGVSIYDIDKILSQKRFSNEDASLILFYDNLK